VVECGVTDGRRALAGTVAASVRQAVRPGLEKFNLKGSLFPLA
jgi:hypothetical protein